MSIPRRRRSIRTVIAELGRAVSELEARVDALEQEDEWLLDDNSWEPVQPLGNIGIGSSVPGGNIGVGSTAPTVTIPADTLVNLDDEASEKVLNIMNFMDDLDDVQEVYTNAEISENTGAEE